MLFCSALTRGCASRWLEPLGPLGRGHILAAACLLVLELFVGYEAA